MKAIRKKPGQNYELIEIENTLPALQSQVGGYIECVYITPYVCVVCNEEGRLYGLPYNVTIGGKSYVGTILVCGTDRDEFTDVPDVCCSLLLEASA